MRVPSVHLLILATSLYPRFGEPSACGIHPILTKAGAATSTVSAEYMYLLVIECALCPSKVQLPERFRAPDKFASRNRNYGWRRFCWRRCGWMRPFPASIR